MGWNWFKTVLGSTFQLNEDDIAVFVVGPTGSGKSTFVSAVTQASGLVVVGQSLKPTTRKVQAVRCQLTGEAREALKAKETFNNIVFIDTPSFLADDNSNKAEKETISWLKDSNSRSTCVGTIYMHRIEEDPETQIQFRVQTQLDTFARTFPPGLGTCAFSQPLRCVFSYVDNIDQSKIDDHQAKFEKQLCDLQPKAIHGSIWVTWKTSTHPDLFVKGDPSTAWDAVKQLISSHHINEQDNKSG